MRIDRQGTVFGQKYELIEAAAQGGMATVWRGVMLGAAGFRRPVAVKRILPHLVSDKEFVRMFVEEARVGSQLQHANIAMIYDFGEDQGEYFLVMEWVDGLDFGRYVYSFFAADLMTSWPMVAAIAIEVLRGLTAAHERPQGPIFHRDINPSNIMVATSGVVKLTDFGLARAMDRGRMTHPDIIKGKLSYMAPELTHGHEATVQSDLFGVGVVLWEALTGRRLFTGASDIDVVLGVRQANIPPVGDLRADLPTELTSLIDRALRTDPGERWQSADTMARALAEMLRGVDLRTDGPAIAQSVVTARQRLAKLPPPPPPLTGEVPTG